MPDLGKHIMHCNMNCLYLERRSHKFSIQSRMKHVKICKKKKIQFVKRTLEDHQNPLERSVIWLQHWILKTLCMITFYHESQRLHCADLNINKYLFIVQICSSVTVMTNLDSHTAKRQLLIGNAVHQLAWSSRHLSSDSTVSSSGFFRRSRLKQNRMLSVLIAPP
jgi:hypothetical protein